jgi:hypothetical protein
MSFAEPNSRNWVDASSRALRACRGWKIRILRLNTNAPHNGTTVGSSLRLKSREVTFESGTRLSDNRPQLSLATVGSGVEEVEVMKELCEA